MNASTIICDQITHTIDNVYYVIAKFFPKDEMSSYLTGWCCRRDPSRKQVLPF